MKVTNVAWLNGGKIGVVQNEDKYKGLRYYIKAVSSLDEEECVKDIVELGHQIHSDIGELIISRYGYPYKMEIT